ncbi:hypothetical protein WKG99_22310 [Pantoea agglomerans]|uniref:hypothetical protein n=1 Tax=Pantoea TaxID=53335 RepID=UPI00132F86DC|nr:hypothetical protein [Pantoea brenneri]
MAPHPRHIQQVVYPYTTMTPVRVPLPVCANSLAGQRRFSLADKSFLRFSLVRHRQYGSF